MKFGFIGTVYCFFIYSLLMYALNSKLGLGEDGLKTFEILSICSLLCSSDVIAAISMISFKDQPKLFSIVYGEGVFNDIVSIIMFGTVQQMFGGEKGSQEEFTAATPFKIIGNFMLLALYSLLIGIVVGLASSLLFKHARFLTHSPVTETLVILIFAFVTYFISDAAQQSGMISLLTCGIVMAHYTWYNLSPQGKTISSVSFTIFGAAAEAFVFAYIGLCVFTYTEIAEDEV